MVAGFIKVRNTNFEWIKFTAFEALRYKYYTNLKLETGNRLEINIKNKSLWNKENNLLMIIYSDDKHAGMVNVVVKTTTGRFRNKHIENLALEAWKIVAEALRFSLAGKSPKQKCWNCFKEKDFRENYCSHCGKS